MRKRKRRMRKRRMMMKRMKIGISIIIMETCKTGCGRKMSSSKNSSGIYGS